MKNLHRLSVAVAFTCVLAVPVFAGQIDTPVAPPTPHAVATKGEIQTPVAGQADDTTTTTDSIAEAALNLLQSVLSLF